ncbi:protein-L-isoaspartate(D-aspartate) O-methyltransferase [Marinitoga hydrogenitolerans DSM 16785]|uniref:Protein-L-isoaspartate O-methyltransferase n=1 Tax=Marinitoga hydrogenitolerans (strain DSM 16785 / JCM 12826 / AT1271) TaxID=1122195 RepID=A0A1M4V3W7_MARH1|nr:methyltransferase domain-containing protein [Marinitoga hydrogenitolerans]SHE63681.1 protein-L-isoaspartate(D-aspartate) O-methyltransferase [Marinitoga hydrogenitolerans DSM 16785]
MLKKYLTEIIKRKIDNLNEKIIKAFEKVPRENFVLSGISIDSIYSDQAIPTFYGKTFLSTSSQPSLMALFFKESGLNEGYKVLDLGTGTGYNAAIMAEIVGEKGLVITTEPEKDVYNIAKENLKNYKNIVILNSDGYYGFEEEKFDVILSTVAVDGIPRIWIEQLKDNGKVIVPIVLGDSLTDYTFIIEKKDKEIFAKFLIHTSFLRALGKLSFKSKIKITDYDFNIEKKLNINPKLFEFCITYFNPINNNISVNSEYGIYKGGILKFKGEKLLNVIENLKDVDLYNSHFKAIEIYDYLNFIPS